VSEQILPRLFRQRLQQYKPALFKGSMFSGLLASYLVLTFAFLIVSRPAGTRFIEALGWGLVVLLAGFLAWQASGSRLRLPLLTQSTPLAAVEIAPAVAPPPGEQRVTEDLVLSLWTAERLPQARFFTTERAGGLPAIRVPAEAEISYPMILPPGSLLRVGFAAVGEGQIEATVTFGDQILANTRSAAGREGGDITWFEIDLSGLEGQPASLRLVTDSDGGPLVAHSEPSTGSPEGLWIMPQILTNASWLLPDPLPGGVEMRPAGYRFGETVELVGYSVNSEDLQPGEMLAVTLCFRLARRDVGDEYITAQRLYPTIFVHLLDEEGQIQAQHDAPPIGGAFPVADWQPGTIITDRHELVLPSQAGLDGSALAIGLYDPNSLERWPVMDATGAPQPDGRALLPLE
jgi:hypothetical protein